MKAHFKHQQKKVVYLHSDKEGTRKSPLFSYVSMENIELLKEKMELLVNNTIADSPDHFLVEVKLLPKKKIQVFVDSETGIKIEKCAQISRALEKVLDEEKWFGDDYNLEVSSPGMDSPLKVLRQYKRRIGREVEVLLNSGVKHEGVLKDANEQGLTIEKTIKLNKKESVTETHKFLFAEIKHTKLILNF